MTCSPEALRAQQPEGDVQQQLSAQKKMIDQLVAAVASQKAEIETLKATRSTKIASTKAASPTSASRPVGRSHAPLADRLTVAQRAVATPPPPGQPIPNDKRLHLGDITITPGGYVAAEGMFRSRTTQSDINTSFMAIPTHNSILSNTNELRLTQRQSKAAALIEGDISPTTHASAYYEMDFQGATTNGNGSNNSYAVRVRHLYATLDFADLGFHVLAGQNWSLITMNSKGITPRNEYIPPTIEANFVPGFMSQRPPQIRLTKDFDKKLWFSVSAEAPQTTFQNGCNALVSNIGAAITPTSIPGTGVAAVTCQAIGTGASFGGTGETTPYSLNHAPDVIGKVAYETTIADRAVHLEALGVYRNFYDAVQYATAVGAPASQSTKSTNGFGVGGGIIVAAIPNRLDFTATGMIGRGLGRYSTAGFGDATLNADGSIKPLQQISFLSGVTLHATPHLDLYLYGGLETQKAAYASNGTLATPTNGAGYIGVGQPNANDTGCEIVGGTCAGNTHTIYQLTGGLWDRIYEGRFGSVRGGLQYSYTKRELFGSTNGPNGSYVTPKTDDHMIFSSFRYYPFF